VPADAGRLPAYFPFAFGPARLHPTLGMRAPWKWNSPRGAVQDLIVFSITTGSLGVWIICLGPLLSSLLASRTSLAQSHPLLYEIANVAISAMMVPWSFGLAFGYYYLYDRYYEKRRKKGGTA
jgi:hypothetical protein